MYNPTVRWHASPSLNVEQYLVAWTLNGVAVLTQTVAQANNLDATVYAAAFSAANSLVVLKANDVVGCTVTAVDVTDTLSSTVLTPTPATITIPATPPLPPVNGTLGLS